MIQLAKKKMQFIKNIITVFHPITSSANYYIIGDRFHDSVKSGHKKAKCKFHNIDLCPELTSYQSVTSEIINGKIKSTQLRSSSQQNIRYYNHLMDYWHNKHIVQKQLIELQKKCKPNEMH